MSESRFSEAEAEFRRAIATCDSEPQFLLDLGECLEKQDRLDEALQVYDQAIGDGGWWPPYLSRAACTERRSGVRAAVAWLESVVPQSPTDRTLPYLIAWFHDEADRPTEAIPFYEKAVEIVCKNHGFRFDLEGWLVLDEASRTKQASDYTDLWPELEQLAECYLKTGQLDLALRTATMGVAAAQQYDRDKDYLPRERIEAGSVPCRLVRARVFLARGRTQEAVSEVRSARAGTGSSGYTGWLNQIEELEKELKLTEQR
jgi:tetratricopeptide (TPR) repeat protein